MSDAERHAPQLSVTLVTFADEPLEWARVVATAEAADAAGIDRLLVSEHLAFGDHLEDYARPELGGMRGGRQPTGPDGHWLEPLTVLAAIGARTTRVRLGTNILLAALRRPAVLAKTLSTLDTITDGRIDLGVGVGWQRAEYEVAGVPFDTRGERLDHTLDVLRVLWRDTPASFDDTLLSFEGIHTMPKPLQTGGIPIWIGGSVHRRVARRLARGASGWIPWGDAAVDVAAAISEMSALLDAEGDRVERLRIAGTLRRVRDRHGGIDLDATMAAAPELAAIGISDFRLALPVTGQRRSDEDTFGRAVEAFRRAIGSQGLPG